MCKQDNYGIWIGENSVVALTNKLEIVFLRLFKYKIISIVKQKDDGVIGVAYGYNSELSSYCEIHIKNRESQHILELHSLDEIIFDNDKLIYKLYDGSLFECILAEKIELCTDYTITQENRELSISKKLELWSIGTEYAFNNDSLTAKIDAHKYSVCFCHYDYGNLTYCRVGLNGYCEKGHAMLSTVCLRDGIDPEGKIEIEKEVQMLKNNFDSLKRFNPPLEYFSLNSCAFPSDGGWYWSVKEVADDFIILNSCGGGEDIRYKKRSNIYEFIL